MNKEKLFSLINNPATISSSDLEELKDEVNDHPYFQVGHILIAKAFHDSKLLGHQDKLGQAAISIIDRNVLKAIIEDRFHTSEVVAEPAVVNEESKADKEQPIVSEEAEKTEVKAEETKVEETQPEDNKTEEKIEAVTEPETTAEAKEEDKPSETEEIKKDKVTERMSDFEVKTDAKKLQAEVVTNDDKSAEEKDSIYAELEANLKALKNRKTEFKEEKKEEKPAVKKTTTRKTTAASTKAKSTSTTSRTGTTKAKTTSSKASSTQAKKTTATTKKKTTAASSKTTTPRKTTAASKTTTKTTSQPKKKATTRRKSAEDVIDEVKKKQKREVKSQKSKDQIKIIDDFIEKESTLTKRRTPAKEDEKPQDDLSKSSTEVKEDLISENLAIIMVKQGKIDKAKDIYKKLIWKFPQKKAYFATQIEELEKEKN
ncbi:hypothetical protein QQ008_28260 [Fulvivirgaceae bacterium BMA10]|uniref:Tetratricopeptide repeat protein n=1 Tax=Splendidivirga corallicola TaxID=3051826 RepID=A0ABT8KWY4_9BACT|nr:hypothetical protein [Fulvivirgaceae bacterium BMA10]